MRTFLLLCLAAVMTGCVTTPPHPQHDQCDKVASYARGVEVLRQVGVTQADTASYVSQPTVAQFPMQRVRSLVYIKKFETPAEAYVYFYDMCTTVGHDNLLRALEGAEKQHLNSLRPLGGMDATLPTPKKRNKR